jgi:DNA repair exonuclease SbcCD ATPase subunit
MFMARMRIWLACLALATALVGAGCRNGEKDATEAAIEAAQWAINSVEAEAQKYVPQELQAARNALQAARDALAKSDYRSALEEAREAANKAKQMAVDAVGKREESAKSWRELSDSIPRSMDQVKGKLDAYSKGARMPEGMDKDMLDSAKAQYEQMKQSWEDAKAEAREGKLGDAIEKATGAKEMLAKLKEMLGVRDVEVRK